MDKKNIFFHIDEKVCFFCHALNPLHSCLFKKIKKYDKKTNKKRITVLTHLLHVYNYVYFKIIHPVLNKLHKKLKSKI
jgi:hypothetical protein